MLMTKSVAIAFAMFIAAEATFLGGADLALVQTASSTKSSEAPAGWELVKSETWCKNRIIVGTGTWEECLDKVVADSKCSKVSYSNPKNDKCFCVPDGETCDEASAGFTALYKYTAPPKATAETPMARVVKLIADLKAKVLVDGEKEQKSFDKYA